MFLEDPTLVVLEDPTLVVSNSVVLEDLNLVASEATTELPNFTAAIKIKKAVFAFHPLAVLHARAASESPPEPAPVREPSQSTHEPAPVREHSEPTQELASVREPSESTPVREHSESTPEAAPVQAPSESTPEPDPVREPSESTPESTPVREFSASTPESTSTHESTQQWRSRILPALPWWSSAPSAPMWGSPAPSDPPWPLFSICLAVMVIWSTMGIFSHACSAVVVFYSTMEFFSLIGEAVVGFRTACSLPWWASVPHTPSWRASAAPALPCGLQLCRFCYTGLSHHPRPDPPPIHLSLRHFVFSFSMWCIWNPLLKGGVLSRSCWCALVGQKMSLCFCLNARLVVYCWCHVLSCLLSDPALLVISLFFSVTPSVSPSLPSLFVSLFIILVSTVLCCFVDFVSEYLLCVWNVHLALLCYALSWPACFCPLWYFLLLFCFIF